MNRTIKYLFVITAISLLCNSCKKMFLGKDSIDPNTATDVPLKLLLPSAEVSVSLLNGMELAWYSSVFMQQQGGVDRQMASADRYVIVNSDLNRPWSNAYANSLSDLKIIIEKAQKQNAWTYSGIAKILTALTLGQLTDAFGDIPYSKALQGSDNIKPAYDTQQDIYNTIQRLLNEAIADLNKISSVSPSQDDYIYNGSVSSWKSTANILKARYHNHLSKVDPVNSAINTLAAIDAGIYYDFSEDAQMPFGVDQTQSNPWYQFVYQRGDIRMGYFLVHLMDSIHDPRLPHYSEKDGNNQYTGSKAGIPNISASLMGTVCASADSKIVLATYVEAKFIEAEAALRSGNPTRAAKAHNDAILGSLDKLGIINNVFKNTYASETAATITLEKIMTQKYIVMFTQQEVWTDWRRTGFPLLKVATNNVLGSIPRRIVYPADEGTYNSQNMPSGISLSSKVWWDN